MSRTPAPLFLLAGGDHRLRRGPDPLISQVLAQAASRRPSIAYVGTASNDNRAFLTWLSLVFRRAGAGEVRLAPLTGRKANPDKARAVLEVSDLVFVSGGDVEAGVQHLEQQGMVPILKRLYAEGKPFFGLSAGSIMLAQSWVRWADPDDDDTAEVFSCLGLTSILCDTHAESDDWEELKVLLRLQSTAVGYGIPSGTALRVDPDGTVAALGKPVFRFASRDGRTDQLAPLKPV